MKIKSIIVVVCCMLFSCIRIDTGKKYCREEHYSGVILDIYQDKINHYSWTYKISNTKFLFDRDAQLWPKSWEYAQVGDSIIKPADTLMIIIKKNDSTKREFFYKF